MDASSPTSRGRSRRGRRSRTALSLVGIVVSFLLILLLFSDISSTKRMKLWMGETFVTTMATTSNATLANDTLAAKDKRVADNGGNDVIKAHDIGSEESDAKDADEADDSDHDDEADREDAGAKDVDGADADQNEKNNDDSDASDDGDSIGANDDSDADDNDAEENDADDNDADDNDAEENDTDDNDADDNDADDADADADDNDDADKDDKDDDENDDDDKEDAENDNDKDEEDKDDDKDDDEDDKDDRDDDDDDDKDGDDDKDDTNDTNDDKDAKDTDRTANDETASTSWQKLNGPDAFSVATFPDQDCHDAIFDRERLQSVGRQLWNDFWHDYEGFEAKDRTALLLDPTSDLMQKRGNGEDLARRRKEGESEGDQAWFDLVQACHAPLPEDLEIIMVATAGGNFMREVILSTLRVENAKFPSFGEISKNYQKLELSDNDNDDDDDDHKDGPLTPDHWESHFLPNFQIMAQCQLFLQFPLTAPQPEDRNDWKEPLSQRLVREWKPKRFLLIAIAVGPPESLAPVCRLMKTAYYYGWDLVLAVGRVDYSGHVEKYRYTLQLLDALFSQQEEEEEEDSIIAFVDSYDNLVQQTPKDTLTLFLEQPFAFLWSPGDCFPLDQYPVSWGEDKFVCEHGNYFPKTGPSEGIAPNLWQHVNSGGWIGWASAARRVLQGMDEYARYTGPDTQDEDEDVFSYPCPIHDDQIYAQISYLRNTHLLGIDKPNDIFAVQPDFERTVLNCTGPNDHRPKWCFNRVPRSFWFYEGTENLTNTLDCQAQHLHCSPLVHCKGCKMENYMLDDVEAYLLGNWEQDMFTTTTTTTKKKKKKQKCQSQGSLTLVNLETGVTYDRPEDYFTSQDPPLKWPCDYEPHYCPNGDG